MEEQRISAEQVHSDDLHDIITAPPSWLLRWGITIVLLVLVSFMGMSALIRYPDIIKTTVRVNAANAPKPVVSRLSGNLVKILVKDGEQVRAGQGLAWIESTAKHQQVLDLLKDLKDLRTKQLHDEPIILNGLHNPTNLQLGELQNAYQQFYQAYLSYKASVDGGIYLQRKMYLKKQAANIAQQRLRLQNQQTIQQKEYELAKKEHEMYEKLAERKVIAPAELQRQQSVLLSKELPLEQTQNSLLNNESSHMSVYKELDDLENQMVEEKSKFMQALNSLISEADSWVYKYILLASQAGSVVYAGIIQENKYIHTDTEIFYINPDGSDFFGEVNIPQYNMGKVKTGQGVLVKLNSFPFEEYGIVKGEVRQVSSVPFKDSLFSSIITLQTDGMQQAVTLKTGMLGSAEIITEDVSLLSRLYRNIYKMVNSRN